MHRRTSSIEGGIKNLLLIRAYELACDECFYLRGKVPLVPDLVGRDAIDDCTYTHCGERGSTSDACRVNLAEQRVERPGKVSSPAGMTPNHGWRVFRDTLSGVSQANCFGAKLAKTERYAVASPALNHLVCVNSLNAWVFRVLLPLMLSTCEHIVACLAKARVAIEFGRFFEVKVHGSSVIKNTSLSLPLLRINIESVLPRRTGATVSKADVPTDASKRG